VTLGNSSKIAKRTAEPPRDQKSSNHSPLIERGISGLGGRGSTYKVAGAEGLPAMPSGTVLVTGARAVKEADYMVHLAAIVSVDEAREVPQV